MKFLLLALMLASSTAMAIPNKKLVLQYKFKGDRLIYTHPNNDYIEALEKGSTACLKAFKASEIDDAVVYEELVDVCANPL